jgi:hypothetical protein
MALLGAAATILGHSFQERLAYVAFGLGIALFSAFLHQPPSK